MASEGLQRRIDRLLDEADDAISKYDWEAVSRDAHAFLAIDPEHSEGLAFLATAEQALATLAPNPASDSGTTTTTEASISTLGTPEHTELPPPVIGASKAERRQLTVRFCDLQSPTALSQQLDLEELRGVIRSYQDVCAGAVVRFNGYVAKYLGDRILIYFGYPQAHEDDPQRAALGGLAILEDMAKEYYAALDSSAGTQLDGVSGDRVLGLVAQAMGEDDGAAQHFEAPLAFCRKAG